MSATQIRRLDHVNVRTGQLDRLTEWYQEMLGLSIGRRPDFDFPGAWLYAGEDALVHLIGCDTAPSAGQEDLHLEHFAFSASGLGEMLDRFEAAGEKVMLRRVPGFPLIQVNVWDPDGNHIHVDFDSAEADALGLP